MPSPCSLCAELAGETSSGGNKYRALLGDQTATRILRKTESLVVLPTIGPLVVGHVLVVTKEHYLSYAHTPAHVMREAEELLDQLRGEAGRDGKVIVFEHGPMSNSATAGGCTDHAHLHLVPVPERRDLVPGIAKRLAVGRRVSGLTALAAQFDAEVPYIYYDGGENECWCFDASTDLPCQFMRRLVAASVGTDEWDWHIFPRLDVLEETRRIYSASVACRIAESP